MNIGEKIKAARLNKGYTQEELGKLIGVQKSAVAKYESGRVVNIKRSVLKKLAEALEMSPVELVTDIEENPKKTANELADIFLDPELMSLIKQYNGLDDQQKAQARDFISFLSKSKI